MDPRDSLGRRYVVIPNAPRASAPPSSPAEQETTPGFIAPPRLLEDLARFARLHVESGDIDPLYPVLRALTRELPAEQALWHTLLYVAFYNIASARAVFRSVPTPWEALAAGAPEDAAWAERALPPGWDKLPTGIERRGLRGGVVARHLAALIDLYRQHGGFAPWLGAGLSQDPRANWRRLQETLTEPYGNGRWAAYKTGEILARVHDWPLSPTDMGHAFSSGPRHGLALFYGEVPGNTARAVATLDAQGEDLLARLRARPGLSRLGIEQLETVLCDFHALRDGRYYVGHDIDQMQEQLTGAELRGTPPEVTEPIWRARRAALPDAYLGELHEWTGVDPNRKRLYRERGVIAQRFGHIPYPDWT